MATSYITPDNVFKRWQDSKLYTDQLTNPFPEFARIARNQPYPGADPAYPSVTDGTAASIVQKTPKRTVQQLPTGVVESDGGEEWLPVIAEFVYTNKILPFANEDYDLFEKTHLVIENGLTFGSCASYTPFINHDGYFCPDMVLPYWGDVYLQKGKKSARSCNYVFIRSWWQPEDIDALIEEQKGIEGTTWDIEALEEVKKNQAQKDKQATTPSEEERSNENTAIELVTAFQKGVGAKFYTFNPDGKKVVRTKVNKDPRGKMPIDWFFGDMDGTNPLGRGIIELIGPLQNLIDSDMQAYQYNRALALQPPVVKYGNVGNFKFEPNAVLDARDDPNAKIVPLTVDTSALINYPQLYGLQKSQLLNLVSSPDTSISADVGNPGFSKTPAGINQQRANLSVDDNAVRKRFEAWFESWSETAINLYFAERTGVEILQLDKPTAKKLRKLAEDGKFDPSLLNDQDQIIINYDEATPALKFRVDASTSKMADDQTQIAGLELLKSSLESSPMLQQLVPPEKVLALWNRLTSLSGVEDPEELEIDIEQFKQEQQLQAQQQMMQQQQMAMPPEQMAAQPEQMPSPDQTQSGEPQLVQHLRQLGLSDQAIAQYVQMALQGEA